MEQLYLEDCKEGDMIQFIGKSWIEKFPFFAFDIENEIGTIVQKENEQISVEMKKTYNEIDEEYENQIHFYDDYELNQNYKVKLLKGAK